MVSVMEGTDMTTTMRQETRPDGGRDIVIDADDVQIMLFDGHAPTVELETYGLSLGGLQCEHQDSGAMVVLERADLEVLREAINRLLATPPRVQ